MNRYRLILAYDGSAYAGWQIQPGHVTVQQRVEESLHRITGEIVRVHGSGRTDQGVHAAGQVAHVDLAHPIAPATMQRAVNAVLPADIRLLRVSTAPAAFHARRSARGKEYRYFIWNGEVLPPFLHRYRTHVRRPLNVAAMNLAAGALVGEHDFAAFTANPSRVVESTVRHLTMLRVRRTGREVVVVARSNGFLYRMVRSLSGLLLRVGEGAVDPGEVPSLLASKVRTARVPTAPPQGLFLWKVYY